MADSDVIYMQENCYSTYKITLQVGLRISARWMLILLFEKFSFKLLSTQKFILFADDPLSGLDSLSSYMLVETLQRLAKNGYTILCTLDQPASDVYFLFNKYVIWYTTFDFIYLSKNMAFNFYMYLHGRRIIVEIVGAKNNYR